MDGDFVTGDSVPFGSEVSGGEVVCTLVCDADGGWLLLFDSQNEKSSKVAKDRVHQWASPAVTPE
jgi:hypothetical protein